MVHAVLLFRLMVQNKGGKLLMSEKFKTVITNEGFRYTELVKSDDKPKISLLDPIASNTAYSDAQLERLTYTEVISQASQIQTGKLTSKKINGQAMS